MQNFGILNIYHNQQLHSWYTVVMEPTGFANITAIDIYTLLDYYTA